MIALGFMIGLLLVMVLGLIPLGMYTKHVVAMRRLEICQAGMPAACLQYGTVPSKKKED